MNVRLKSYQLRWVQPLSFRRWKPFRTEGERPDSAVRTKMTAPFSIFKVYFSYANIAFNTGFGLSSYFCLVPQVVKESHLVFRYISFAGNKRAFFCSFTLSRRSLKLC